MEEKTEIAFRILLKSVDLIVPWSHYLKLMQVQDDNPQPGIVLCSDTNEDVERYSGLCREVRI